MANSNTKSHLKDLLLLFSIPVGVAIITALVVYVPRMLANPAYDFIYASCDDYQCGKTYAVDGSGRVSDTQNPKTDFMPYSSEATLRYYDTKRNASRNMTLEEAKQYRLDTTSRSPDGYTLSRESGGSGGFLFWRDGHDGWYLQDGAKKKKIDLMGKSDYNITFLGWVVK